MLDAMKHVADVKLLRYETHIFLLSYAANSQELKPIEDKIYEFIQQRKYELRVDSIEEIKHRLVKSGIALITVS